MVSSEEKLANAMGGKTVRVCDSCITKRARWYCAADNAFLCQFCDTLVHSANPLARSHERVHLKVASTNLSSLEIPTPSWHQGFTKKSRTPRGKNSNKHVSHRTSNPLHLVPEIESDELDTENIDEQLPYQVPVFDPFLGNDVLEDPFHMHGLNGFVLPSDLELAKFAADVQSLLGKSLDEESFDAESLGIADFRLNDLVKVEKEMMGEPFELSFDYDSRVAWEEEDEKVKNEDEKCEIFFDHHVNNYDNIHNTSKKNMKMLKLDYEGIIAAWDDDRSPWTNGDRPELDPNDCWPECIGGCGKMQHCHRGDKGMMKGNSSRLDEGREARVSRYREKRRTRLFSKKIRYEVRKLNAEKRPRMKGRFVKRTSFVA